MYHKFRQQSFTKNFSSLMEQYYLVKIDNLIQK